MTPEPSPCSRCSRGLPGRFSGPAPLSPKNWRNIGSSNSGDKPSSPASTLMTLVDAMLTTAGCAFLTMGAKLVVRAAISFTPLLALTVGINDWGRRWDVKLIAPPTANAATTAATSAGALKRIPVNRCRMFFMLLLLIAEFILSGGLLDRARLRIAMDVPQILPASRWRKIAQTWPLMPFSARTKRLILMEICGVLDWRDCMVANLTQVRAPTHLRRRHG